MGRGPLARRGNTGSRVPAIHGRTVARSGDNEGPVTQESVPHRARPGLY